MQRMARGAKTLAARPASAVPRAKRELADRAEDVDELETVDEGTDDDVGEESGEESSESEEDTSGSASEEEASRMGRVEGEGRACPATRGPRRPRRT